MSPARATSLMSRDFFTRRAKIALPDSLAGDKRSICGKSTREQSVKLSMKVAWLSGRFWKPPRGVKVHYGCFQSFQSEWLANGDCRSRFGDVPRQEMAGHGVYWRRKIPKKDNWWRKQPYLHSEPFLEKIILKKTSIWTKFQSQDKAKQNPCWVLNCCYSYFKGKKIEVSTRRRAALTQSFPLARSDIPTWKEVWHHASYDWVQEAVVVLLKRQEFAKVDGREPTK